MFWEGIRQTSAGIGHGFVSGQLYMTDGMESASVRRGPTKGK